MSFGGPGGGQISYKPTPPERGSFPLEYVAPRESFSACADIKPATMVSQDDRDLSYRNGVSSTDITIVMQESVNR